MWVGGREWRRVAVPDAGQTPIDSQGRRGRMTGARSAPWHTVRPMLKVTIQTRAWARGCGCVRKAIRAVYGRLSSAYGLTPLFLHRARSGMPLISPRHRLATPALVARPTMPSAISTVKFRSCQRGMDRVSTTFAASAVYGSVAVPAGVATAEKET
jgi:hypothetical protein